MKYQQTTMEKCIEGFALFLAAVFLVFCLVGIGQSIVDIGRWVNYRTEVQQIRLEKGRTELETMKARLEKIKGEKE